MKNMKKIVVFSAALILLAAVFAVTRETKETDIFEIKEKMFIQQCNDINFNIDEYVGKTVRLEGLYKAFRFPKENGEVVVHYVYRKTPGCCGDDGEAGFMVFIENCPVPELNAWVEATGKVEVTDIGLPVLRLSSLKVMNERGAEFVIR